MPFLRLPGAIHQQDSPAVLCECLFVRSVLLVSSRLSMVDLLSQLGVTPPIAGLIYGNRAAPARISHRVAFLIPCTWDSTFKLYRGDEKELLR
jgi:hypothetical protein